MVGLDVVAFFAGLFFGKMMKTFRIAIKYFAPVAFLMGYVLFAFGSVPAIIGGAVFVGIATGVGVPYLNTIASIKGGRNSATTVMPLLSAALYLGQFLSPIVVLPLSKTLFTDDVAAAYKIGVMLCVAYLLQVYSTRHF